MDHLEDSGDVGAALLDMHERRFQPNMNRFRGKSRDRDRAQDHFCWRYVGQRFEKSVNHIAR